MANKTIAQADRITKSTLPENVSFAQEHAESLAGFLISATDSLRWPNESPGVAREQLQFAEAEVLRVLFWLRAIADDARKLDRAEPAEVLS